MKRAEMEIERKYLIRMPDVRALEAMAGCELWEIRQTYLLGCGKGYTHRLRRMRVNGRVVYIENEKRRVNQLRCAESEREISREEYEGLMLRADPELRSIEKRRYRIPYGGHTMEIDIYDFWSDRATLEVELSGEDEALTLPPWLDVVRELTGDAAYKNYALAREVPMEALACI